jgi:hypothetical protein
MTQYGHYVPYCYTHLKEVTKPINQKMYDSEISVLLSHDQYEKPVSILIGNTIETNIWKEIFGKYRKVHRLSYLFNQKLETDTMLVHKWISHTDNLVAEYYYDPDLSAINRKKMVHSVKIVFQYKKESTFYPVFKQLLQLLLPINEQQLNSDKNRVSFIAGDFWSMERWKQLTSRTHNNYNNLTI